MSTTKFSLGSVTFAAIMAAGMASAAEFQLSSPDLGQMQSIGPVHYGNGFGCDGGNSAPKLEWKNPPTGTRSYAVNFHDEDAPTGSGFWHWMVYNISADTKGLQGGEDGGPLPVGAVQGNTDVGKPGFLGPCPPTGRQHRYRWAVHALKVDKLPAEAGDSPALVGFYLWQNRLAEASLTVMAGPR